MITPDIIISNKYNVGNRIYDFMLREKVTGNTFRPMSLWPIIFGLIDTIFTRMTGIK